MRKTFIDTIVSRNDEYIQDGNKGERLLDISSTGKVRPWEIHKKSIYPIAKSYERLGMADISDQMLDCGQWLKFETCENGKCSYQRLVWANFCRKRLCPMCGWRKSYRVAVDVRNVCHEAYQRYFYKGKLRWLLLTLTVRNVQGHKELNESLKMLSTGWQRLTQRKIVKKAMVGSFRAVEVTINNDKYKKYTKGKRKGQLMRTKKGDLVPNEWYGSYHPHIHALVAVPSSYFKKSYIKQSEWVRLWQESCRLDYAPSVDVRPVKDKRDIVWEETLKEELNALKGVDQAQFLEMKRMDGAVAEVSKYATKASDIISSDEDEMDRRVWELNTVLRGKRFMSYTGLLRDCWLDLRKKSKVEDAESEEADLIHIGDREESCNCPTCNSALLETVYGFFSKDGGYYKTKEQPKGIEQEVRHPTS